MTCFYERILHHTTYIPTPPTKDVFLSLRFSFVAQGAGVLRIQLTGMIEWEQKSKPNAKEMPTASDKTPKKSLGQKLPPKNIPSRISKP